MHRLALALLITCSGAACARPSILVCDEVSPAGVCSGPTRVLHGGQGYTMVARGFGLPDGEVTIRLDGARPDGRSTHATRKVRVASERDFVTAPIQVLYEGEYRIAVVDEDGDVFARTAVQVTRTEVRPVPPWHR